MVVAQQLLDLAERFRATTDDEEMERLGDELGRMLLGGSAIVEGLEDVRKGRVYGPFDIPDQMLTSLKGKRGKSVGKVNRFRQR